MLWLTVLICWRVKPNVTVPTFLRGVIGEHTCSSSEFAAEILEIKKSKDPGRETGLQATIENNLKMCIVLAGLRQERKAQSFVETSDTCMP